MNRNMLVPRKCACGHAEQRTPWHCACGRWKRSDRAMCETCAQVVEFADELDRYWHAALA